MLSTGEILFLLFIKFDVKLVVECFLVMLSCVENLILISICINEVDANFPQKLYSHFHSNMF